MEAEIFTCKFEIQKKVFIKHPILKAIFETN